MTATGEVFNIPTLREMLVDMSSIIEKAKDKATQLTHQAKDKVDDLKEGRRLDALYDELGRIAFRQHTSTTEVGDTARAASIVAELKQHDTTSAHQSDSAAMKPPPPAPG